MILKEIAEKEFGDNIGGGFIGFYEEDENGNVKPIYPDYADEIIETHGEKEVIDYRFLSDRNILVAEIKND